MFKSNETQVKNKVRDPLELRGKAKRDSVQLESAEKY